jgi:hypothetical protein
MDEQRIRARTITMVELIASHSCGMTVTCSLRVRVVSEPADLEMIENDIECVMRIRSLTIPMRGHILRTWHEHMHERVMR